MLRINNLVDEIWFTTAQEAEDPVRDLKKTAEILNLLGLDWYLSFGTALGFYRDKDFIKGDTDIDVCVISEFDADEIIEKFEEHYKFIRQVSFNGEVMQLAFQGEDRFIIDVCFFYPNEHGRYSYCEGGMWQDKNYGIGTLNTKYGDFPIPLEIEDYLEQRYGDWRTPKYGSITSSIKA